MQLRNANRLLSVSVLTLGGLTYSGSVFAAGFALRNSSASSAGTSLSSDTVNTFDASGVLSNPALMTSVTGQNLGVNIDTTSANITAKNAVSSPSSQFTNASYAGVQGSSSNDDVSDTVVIPTVYGVFQISDDQRIGFSFGVPYGTNTEYKNDWAGRYQALKTNLNAMDFGLHYAIKINDAISVGASIDWQRAVGELSQATDLGLISYGVNGQAAQQYAAAAQQAQAAGDAATAQAAQAKAQQYQAAATQSFGLIGKADSISRFKGTSDTGWGFGLGVLVKPTDSTRVGLSFKSQVHHKADGGDLTWSDQNAAATQIRNGLIQGLGAAGARFADNHDAELSLKLPAVISLGVAQVVGDFTIYANVTETTWKTFDELDIAWANQSSVTKLDWHNSVYYAIGADYHLAEMWTLRAGIGHDQSVVDDDHRTPRTPDNDRTVASIGASFKWAGLDISATYQRIIMEDAKIQLLASSYADNNVRGNLDAKMQIEPSIAILSAGYSF